MTLAGIKPGDLVRVAGSHAVVVEKERGRLLVLWIGSNSSRWVKAGEVEAHWRRTGR
jgi:ribosomal protein L2